MNPPAHKGTAGPLFDSFAASLVENPYPHYDRVRSAEPVYWDPVFKAWILTRYADVLEVLKDETFEVFNLSETIAHFGRKMRKDYGPLIKITEAFLFFTTGERHKRDRRTLTRVLTNIPPSQLQPVIDGFARSLADELSTRNEFDAVLDYAEMFPAFVITRILGLPASDAPLLLALAKDFTHALDVTFPSVYDRLNQKAAVAIHHLSRRISHAVAAGDRTGLSLIYNAVPLHGEAKLSSAAVLAFTLFLLGTETTSSVVGSCINNILQRPELYGRLRDNPLLAARIATEVTRLESPVQRVFRTAREERVIGGRIIRQGDRIVLLLGAANRDPSVFMRPADLDPARENTEDLAFGAGRHACLGKSLARLEAEIAVKHFLNMPPLERSGLRDAWHSGKSIRRLTKLPVRLHARS